MRPLQTFALRPRAPHTAARPLVAAIAVSLAFCPAAPAAVPAPCGGVAQISDVTGDGHHANTDVSSAWFSEQAGPLQAVIKVATGDWRPMHVDSTTASWSLLFEVAAQQHYVRAVAQKNGTLAYDYGTWTLAGGFVTAAATTGAVTTGPGGTVTIDVPPQTGAAAGTVLARPFVLTYESDPAEPGPVDRGPGGATAGEAAFGADYVVGSCQPAGTGGSGAGSGEGAAGGEAPRTTMVVLAAPTRIVGARRVRAAGRVVPARRGVHVQVTTKARGSSKPAVVRSAWTLEDGSFSLSVPVSEKLDGDRRRRADQRPDADRARAVQGAPDAAPRRGRQDGRQRPGVAAPARTRPAAAHQRGDPVRPSGGPPRPLPLCRATPCPRPLPGRLHPGRPPRRKVHLRPTRRSMTGRTKGTLTPAVEVRTGDRHSLVSVSLGG